MAFVYVLTEEESAATVVEAIADRIGLKDSVKVLSHAGAPDLEKRFPRKIRALVHPAGCSFVVLRDNDGKDCGERKKYLSSLVPDLQRARTRIRLLMQELESWYLGDLEALRLAGVLSERQAAALKGKSRFRKTEEIPQAKQLFNRLHEHQGQQVMLARMIGPHLDPDRNLSPSFRLFVRTLRQMSA